MNEIPSPYVMLAYAWGREGDLRQALAPLDRYAAFFPPNESNVLDTRGDLLVRSGHYEEGVAAYREHLELNPTGGDLAGFWRCIDKVALGCLFQGNYSQAEAAARSTYKKGKGVERAKSAEVLGDIEAGRGRLDHAVIRYEEASRIYASQDALTERPVLLKAAKIYFEQQQPEAALALSRRHSSYWAAGVRGMAQLLLENSVEAEREFANLRASASPLCGEFMAGKIDELHRLLAAFYAGRFQDVIADWPQIRGTLRKLCALEVGRAYLETGRLAEAEPQLRFTVTTQLAWDNINDPADFFTYTLARFYQGKLWEQAGKRAEAIEANQEFPRHFDHSTAILP